MFTAAVSSLELPSLPAYQPGMAKRLKQLP